jgi:hypothetical protein
MVAPPHPAAPRSRSRAVEERPSPPTTPTRSPCPPLDHRGRHSRARTQAGHLERPTRLDPRRSVRTSLRTSTLPDPSNASRNLRKLDLDPPGPIYTSWIWLRSLWTSRSVVVRVHYGACGSRTDCLVPLAGQCSGGHARFAGPLQGNSRRLRESSVTQALRDRRVRDPSGGHKPSRGPALVPRTAH